MFNYEDILGRMLSNVRDDIDKREGSVIYDAMAPAALELARFYSELTNVINETFADTAGREMLVRRAAERGITPRPATFSTVRGEFNIAVPAGTRFSLGELRYRVIGDNRLMCENVGSVGNRTVGDLIPIGHIDGLTSSRIAELLIPGDDDEDVESLRKRYLDSLETQSYGGNISDYRRVTLAIPGVGGVKVEPVFSGGGTVRIIIQDYRWLIPSPALISEVQNLIDPVNGSGNGEGIAPIGHKVTVAAVNGVNINISARFTLAAGWQFESARPQFEEILDGYLNEIAAEWDKSDELVIRASQIESRLLNHNAVVDIENLRINNGTSGRNVTLSGNTIPLRGVISNA
jgi:uncharacterized phage protein gp47/JayE